MAITFTEDDVVAAYRRHPEYKPKTGAYFGRKRNGVTPCCPLAILCVDKGPIEVPKQWFGGSQVAQILGISFSNDVVEFIRAFDFLGESLSSNQPAYRFGRRVLRRLATEGMLSPKLTAKVLSLPEPE